MMHPDTELRFVSPEIGYGVFATKVIPAGTLTWVGDALDQHLTEADISRLDPLCREMVDRYAYVAPTGKHVLCWDHGRFVNHSCNPNCRSSGFDFEFALRTIEAGEELTDDYGLMNLSAGFECRCGSPSCRKLILGSDLEQYGSIWDEQISRAFPMIAQVPQPLWRLLEDQERGQVEQVLAGGMPIPSCKLHQLHMHPATSTGCGAD